MKKTTVIIAASLAANAALSFVLIKSAAETSPTENPHGPAFVTARPSTNLPGTTVAVEATAAWKKLHNPDLAIFAANLRAAGMPEYLLRAIILAEIDAQFLPREQALRPMKKKIRFWEMDDTQISMETRLAQLDLRREKARLRAQLLGSDPISPDDDNPVAPEKREQLRLIVEDYDTMISALRTHPQLDSELQKIKYLEAEKRREIAGLLSAEELANYEMRVSQTTRDLRFVLRGFGATAEEFEMIYTAQKTLEERFADTGKETLQQRLELAQLKEKARQQMNEELKTQLGEVRYAEYMRSRTLEFQQIRQLALRAGLPESAAQEAFGLREMVVKESERIANQPGRTVEQKRAELTKLAQDTRTEMLAKLGPDAGAAYVRLAGWLQGLEKGNQVLLSDQGWGTKSIPEPAEKP